MSDKADGNRSTISEMDGSWRVRSCQAERKLQVRRKVWAKIWNHGEGKAGEGRPGKGGLMKGGRGRPEEKLERLPGSGSVLWLGFWALENRPISYSFRYPWEYMDWISCWLSRLAFWFDFIPSSPLLFLLLPPTGGLEQINQISMRCIVCDSASRGSECSCVRDRTPTPVSSLYTSLAHFPSEPQAWL
jgi:hypothetical protein